MPALLSLPADPVALCVHGHGAGAGMNHAAQEAISGALCRQGIGTLRYEFPFRAMGRRRVDSQAVSVAAVRAAAEFARDLLSDLPIFLSGHSFGGRMSTHAVLQPFEGWSPRGLVLGSFPLHPAGKPSIDRAAHLDTIDLPMLFLSGTRDGLAEVDLLSNVCDRLGDRARLHWLDTADHGYKVLKRSRISDENVFDEFGRIAGQFVRKVLS